MNSPLAHLSHIKKYSYLRSKYKNYFYFFNNQLNYNLAYYFIKSEITIDYINIFLTYLLIAFFNKNLSYKNTDEYVKKLLKISQSILKNIQIEYKFDIKNIIFKVVGQKIII